MHSQRPKLLQRSTLVVLVLLVAGAADADSAIAQAFFDSGNAAFRQGDFRAAVGHYNDALANGKNTSRVFYNKGLAHLRLGQHEQARSALHESSRDSSLSSLSYYALGVMAEKEGEIQNAIDWLRLARANANSDKLRRQSARALATMGVFQPAFESALSIGFGYDSNAFRSPDLPYIDFSTATPTPVVPTPQSGPYIPIRIKSNYWRPVSARSALTASYSFRGEYHTDSELENSDFDDHRVTIGGERKVGSSGSANRRIAMGAFYRVHGETNFDRDDGLDRFDDGVSIADRYDYYSVGAKADLENRIGVSRYELNAGWEQRDYDDVLTASSYDMTNYWFNGGIKFPLSNASRIELAYQYYVRDFDERRSRDLTGDATLANPTLKYGYQEISAGIKHRFSNRFVTEIIYSHTTRSDEFVGYNEYARDKIRLAATMEFADRLQASLRLDYRDQDYPNAFAFDEPTQPQKEYQELEAILVVNYELTNLLSIRANIRQEFVESSDPRGEYDRMRGSIGVYWEFER